DLQRAILAGVGILLAGLILTGTGLRYIVTRTLRPIRTLTNAATAIAGGDLGQAVPVSGNDEFGALARTFNAMAAQLRGLVGTLEQRVADRTADLERRSQYLQASAEVAQAMTSILDSDRLGREVVELIRERFGLYYVG